MNFKFDSLFFVTFCLFVATPVCADDDERRPTPSPSEKIALCPSHPNIDDILRKGAGSYTIPSTHPTIHPLFTPYMPRDHPNLDRLLARGKHYDEGDHPKMEGRYTYRTSPEEQCYDFSNTINASGCPATTSSLHPSVDESIAAGTKLPVNHPRVHAMLADWMPANHRDIDDLMAAGTPMPVGHPLIDPYMCRNSTVYTYAVGCPTNVSASHPSIDKSIASGRSLPSGHPLTDHLLRAWMPEGHSNIDDLMKANTPLPLGHPLLDPYICRLGNGGSGGCAPVYNGHPSVDKAVFAGEGMPNGHPKVHDMLKDFLPDGHENCDDLLEAGTPLPEWHPSIDKYMCEEPLVSAGILLAISCFALFVLAVLGRCIHQHHINAITTPSPKTVPYAKVARVDESKNQVRPGEAAAPVAVAVTGGYVLGSGEDLEPSAPPMIELPPTKQFRSTQDNVIIEDIEGGFDGELVEDAEVAAEPSEIVRSMREEVDAYHEDSVPRRNLQIHNMKILHAQHKAEEKMYEYGEYENIHVPEEMGPVEDQLPPRLKGSVVPSMRLRKKNSFLQRVGVVLSSTRVPYFQWTLATVLTVVLYLLLNVLCLLIAPSHNYGASFGSLAVCNTMLLVIPASRNSILALGLGMPFDQVVVYHRVIGRVAVLFVVIHGFYYINSRSLYPNAFDTGIGALVCGLFIYITSLNYVRRNFFNIFYWSHYSFIGFLALAYFHSEPTKPFIIVAVVLYLADKVLRWVWMLWPRRTTTFKLKSESVVQVRFPKNPITKGLEMHRVGQYYFLNFPALSLTEWHPFSVSSGPREDSIEVHIRGLGDHTNRVVSFAKQKEKANESTYVLMDGPYGLSKDFKYRRYPVILLGAGGIGVTPIMGILKDVYDIGVSDQERRHAEPHAINTIYFLWVMPAIEDYECFRCELEMCIEAAKSPDKPNLVPMIYITRSKQKKLKPPFAAGRPNVGNIFRILDGHNPDEAGLVFACGPQALVSELWDKSVQQTVKGRLIDFHHEIFDF